MKRIGISLRVQKIEGINEKRDAISHDWIHFLQELNYFPILNFYRNRLLLWFVQPLVCYVENGCMVYCFENQLS